MCRLHYAFHKRITKMNFIPVCSCISENDIIYFINGWFVRNKNIVKVSCSKSITHRNLYAFLRFGSRIISINSNLCVEIENPVFIFIKVFYSRRLSPVLPEVCVIIRIIWFGIRPQYINTGVIIPQIGWIRCNAENR